MIIEVGKTYLTKDGEEVHIECLLKNPPNNNFPYIGTSKNCALYYDVDGKTAAYSHLDVVSLKPNKKKGWMNIYANCDRLLPYCAEGPFTSREVADRFAGNNRIDCIEVEWKDTRNAS